MAEEDTTKSDTATEAQKADKATRSDSTQKTQSGTPDDPIINSTKTASTHDVRSKDNLDSKVNEAEEDVEKKVKELEAKIKALEVEKQVHTEARRTGVSEDLLAKTGLSGAALSEYADSLKKALDSAGKASSIDAAHKIADVINNSSAAPKRDGWAEVTRQIRERFN